LPCAGSAIDGFGYANYIRDGVDLFLPHHLLFNFLGYIWYSLFSFLFNGDALQTLKVMNAFAAALSLLVVGVLLRRMKVDTTRSNALILLVGSSWGIMRFATENETYVLPIFVSLLASLQLIVYIDQKKYINLIASGFLAALACLFHQIHFFWWLAILIVVIRERRIKSFVYYLLPALIVPITYILVLVFYYSTPFSFEALLQFTFRDYYSSSAGVSIGVKSIMFTSISFIRTFIQVHGYMVNMIKQNYLLVIPVIFSFGLWGIALYRTVRLKMSPSELKSPIALMFIFAFCFQLFFAFLSYGNAEFMVMLPFLVAPIIAVLLVNDIRCITFLAVGILLWNVCFGLFPLNRYQIDGNKMVADHITMSQNKFSNHYIVFSKPAIDNRVRYLTGDYPKNTISATQDDNVEHIKDLIRSELDKGNSVYTDCLFRPHTLSRESLTQNTNENLFKGFGYHKIDSLKTLTGIYYLVKLEVIETSISK
jgi:hypothetical protein